MAAFPQVRRTRRVRPVRPATDGDLSSHHWHAAIDDAAAASGAWTVPSRSASAAASHARHINPTHGAVRTPEAGRKDNANEGYRLPNLIRPSRELLLTLAQDHSFAARTTTRTRAASESAICTARCGFESTPGPFADLCERSMGGLADSALHEPGAIARSLPAGRGSPGSVARSSASSPSAQATSAGIRREADGGSAYSSAVVASVHRSSSARSD